jgi:hypothetical protein
VSKEVYPIIIVRNVTTAIHLSNIYHLLKAYQYDLSKWTTYLKEHGVPTLVESVRTGNTPPVDFANFNWDGLEEL